MKNYKKGEHNQDLNTAVETIKEAFLVKFDKIVVEIKKSLAKNHILGRGKNALKQQRAAVYYKNGKIHLEAKFETQKQKVTRMMSPYLLDEEAKPKKFVGNFSLKCSVKLVEADEK